MRFVYAGSVPGIPGIPDGTAGGAGRAVCRRARRAALRRDGVHPDLEVELARIQDREAP
jgi:hypothetical protein